MTTQLSPFRRSGTGVLETARITGLRKHQIRFIADAGHLGPVRRVNGERRFDEAQLALLVRIGTLRELGLLLPEAAALARQETAAAAQIDVVRVSHVARDTAAAIQRSLQGWLYLCELIDRRLNANTEGGAEQPPVRIA